MWSKFFWFNVIGFNLAWFGLVVIGNSFIPVAILWLFCHLYLCRNKRKELIFITLVTAIGITLDSCLLQLSLFQFDHEQSAIIPFWLITLWACFAATLRHSLAFLQQHLLLPVIFGGVLVPLSYFAGEMLGAVSFPKGAMTTFLILAIEWVTLLLFTTLLIKKENKGYA